jgi:hypothetical protein
VHCPAPTLFYVEPDVRRERGVVAERDLLGSGDSEVGTGAANCSGLARHLALHRRGAALLHRVRDELHGSIVHRL